MKKCILFLEVQRTIKFLFALKTRYWKKERRKQVCFLNTISYCRRSLLRTVQPTGCFRNCSSVVFAFVFTLLPFPEHIMFVNDTGSLK